MRLLVTTAFLLSLMSGASMQAGQAFKPDRALTEREIHELTIAIQDEIYDSGYLHEFWAFATSGERGAVAEFPIYVKPLASWNGTTWSGVVIYKYPPFGEVLRIFYIVNDADIVILGGSPKTGFPWTQPDSKTLYMNDDEVCQDKHDWRKVPFSLDLKPTAQRFKDASIRQKRRVGSSNQEMKNRPAK